MYFCLARVIVIGTRDYRKNSFISFFTNGANHLGLNRPVRKMVLERIVPGGTGFGANRPVTVNRRLDTVYAILYKLRNFKYLSDKTIENYTRLSHYYYASLVQSDYHICCSLSQC